MGVFTVRKKGTGRSLFNDPAVGWRWAGAGIHTPLTPEEAEKLAQQFGGVVCEDGIPLGVTLPKPPKMPKGRAPGEPDKAGELRATVASENWREALRMATKLPRLGDDKKTIERAWEAFSRPDFCRQLGRDPEALIAAGVAVLKRRFGGKG